MADGMQDLGMEAPEPQLEFGAVSYTHLTLPTNSRV